ncbi:hypothetical protein K0M31_003054 [Melipona bicolor]|uniref:Uncharacterized protein n=1 Tax=Melipona bicolor TaxID=60889 RepID=A0AA40KQ33_9HYME|nr:hypothetical protein K0M31_003054 [Melipona bicolor]
MSYLCDKPSWLGIGCLAIETVCKSNIKAANPGFGNSMNRDPGNKGPEYNMYRACGVWSTVKCSP